MHLFSIILNQEIRRLSTQVIRVKWSLHDREEIVFELLQHVRGNLPRALLEGVRKSTRQMIEEQEAVCGRLFTIQDVMQSTVRAWLQDRSLSVTHNLGVFGGCGLILSIITGPFGINVDGIPGAEGSPYAFVLFSGILFLLGAALIAIGLLYLGLKSPITDEHVEVRKLELQELVRIFQQEAESHAQVQKNSTLCHLTSNCHRCTSGRCKLRSYQLKVACKENVPRISQIICDLKLQYRNSRGKNAWGVLAAMI